MTKKVDMIVDLQYGSTGKGLFAGFMSALGAYDVIVNANMPNAGHTCIDQYGNRMVHRVLPSGILGKPEFVMLGPGSVFDMDRLLMEMHNARGFGYPIKVLIHHAAVPLQDYHPILERDLVKTVGSTASGAMAATVEKMARDPADFVTAGERWDIGMAASDVWVVDQSEWHSALQGADRILAEGSQGYSLGLNGKFYPYCTSRDCTPARFLAEMAIPHNMLMQVLGVARTYPIRVGGNSGPCYEDQTELTWSDLGVEPEKTTTTNRERRVFTFSPQQIKDACFECAPDAVFLNFCNYCKNEAEVAHLMEVIGCYSQVLWSGWGPSVKDIREQF